MAERRKSQLPEDFAEIVENFKRHDSASRPRVGMSNQKFMGFAAPSNVSSTSFLEESTRSVTKKLFFEASTVSNTSYSVPTDVLLRSAAKRRSDASDATDFASPTKKFPTTPGGGIDWSPVCREQRYKLLESVDARISDLHSMAAKQETFKKDMMSVIDTEKMLLERQKEKDKLAMQRMKEQVDGLSKKKQETEDLLLAAENKLREQKAKHDLEKFNWQKDYSCLEQKHNELLSEHQRMESSLKHKIELQESDLQTTKNINTQQQNRLNHLEDEVNKLKAREFQEQALREVIEVKEVRIRDLELELDSKRESLLIERRSSVASSATSKKVQELEDKLIQSKELLRGKLLLEEKANSLQEQASKVDQMAQKCAILEQLVKTKDSELKEWHAMAINTVSEIDEERISPRSVSSVFQNLEQKIVVLRSDLSEAVSQLKSANREKEIAEAQLRSEQERRISIQTSAEAQAVTLRKMERKLQLIIQERDSIQQVLTAYEGDLTIAPNQMKLLQQKRIESAEKSAKELREMVQQLEQELAQTKSGDTSPANREFTALQEKLQLCENDLQKAKSRVTALEELNEEMKMLLERRALRGDYNPSETKVMHFRMNPLAQEDARKAEEMKRLREANDRLKEKVKILQSKEKSFLNVTAVADENLQIESNRTINELRKQLESSEVKNTRLIEAFKKSSKEFRQSLYLLLGYKVERMQNGLFKLTSTYCADDEYLLFNVRDDDTIEMPSTPFAETIQELIRLHLEDQNSYPAFLSALTLDLYSRQSYTS
ncbi:mitotic spindle assembly checkpoint protein MAD1 isoform X1 [Neocloeon triangulifer]|uniref:mitotic spindle assembly checkpoint protein MAD1 isoform X1 n=1 Tax=Neocloeon triangulifer TaxID=2078957 RepID=UPI00286EE09F|nr:mitotic spindle assembly checkpoint protein MAD1 isoform X1 [Neocloeon triangulifer]XP_059469944.1 mitotic spindle assembly checkpoint protein MAD1 isoform X1 [Neocloeon triangulifer]